MLITTDLHPPELDRIGLFRGVRLEELDGGYGEMFVRIKKIGGHEYMYLVENAREGGRHVMT